MPTQRDLAHANNLNINVVLDIQLGNANIGDSTITIDGNDILDPSGNKVNFKNSFQYDLGLASNLQNKEIEIFSTLSPNPAITDKTLTLTYNMTNATFITQKNRTIASNTYSNGYDVFDVTIKII